MYTYPIFTIKTKLPHLNEKWYPGGIQMVHTVVDYCPNLDKDLNNYENKLFAPRSIFYALNVTYVVSSITPYTSN